MPKRSRARRDEGLARLQRQLDKVTGDGTCVAMILPMVGVAMRCRRPCTRCRALAAEVARLQPEWDRVRDEYRRANADSRQPRTQEQQERR